jgi:uncharacterized delta-60 repeat protein
VLVSPSPLATAPAQAAPGDLDPTFGVAGMQTTDLGGSEDAAAAAIQQDGKIVVAGGSFRGGRDDFALARYNPDGSLDASFSGDGKVVTDFGGSQSARDLALQPDGKLVVAGDGVIARYNPDGTLDSSKQGSKSRNPERQRQLRQRLLRHDRGRRQLLDGERGPRHVWLHGERERLQAVDPNRDGGVWEDHDGQIQPSPELNAP